MSYTPPAIHQARREGKAHGIKVVTVQERRDPAVPGIWIDAWVVYRRGARIGKRRDAAAVLRLVRSLMPKQAEEAAHAG